MSSKVLLSVAEVSAATGLGQRIIRESIGRGEIPSKRFGRLIKVPAWWLKEQATGTRSEPEAV